MSYRRLRLVLSILAVFALSSLVATAQTPVPTFAKSFAPNTIGPGSVSTLQFTITNGSSSPVSGLAFTDNLPAGMTIGMPSNASSTCEGTLSAPHGGNTVILNGGRLGGSSSCTVRVDVTSSTSGAHVNTTGDLTSDAGNSGSATATLTVATDRPGFSKSFSPPTVALGGRSTLTLTIDNSANSSTAASLTFTDSLPLGLTIASPAKASTTCTGGTLSAPSGGSTISYWPVFGSEASVAAGGTCTVSVDVIGGGVGFLVNKTGDLTSISPPQFSTRSSGMASATLYVTASRIALMKSFTDDPVPPGGTVNLAFTILNRDRSSAATNVTFTDNLEAVVTGLAPSGALPSEPCGTGSVLSFATGVLTLSGGRIAPSGSCEFNVPLQVPGFAPTGVFLNTTSGITGDIGGSFVAGQAASELLFISAVPWLTKTFVGDPVGAGGSVVLSFTLTNTSPVSDATDLSFEDVLDVVLPTASSVPADGFCGAGSTATYTPLIPSGNGTPAKLSVFVPTLAAGESCTFDVTLDVFAGASTGTYPNTTSIVTAMVDGAAVTGSAASDDLDVLGAPRLLKEFIDDPVQPGGTATLQFTLTHDVNAPGDATAITFSDDLDAALSGLAASGLPLADVCGIGSQISGTSTLTFSGGTLTPDSSCTFSVTVQVPGNAGPGNHTNTTSSVAATVTGVETESLPASDDLRVAGLTLTKEFTDDPVLPGGSVTLQFSISNASPTETATDITFQDHLDVVVANLAATGVPLSDVCGAGSTLAGLSANRLLSFSGGTLAPGESCTFDVTLDVPVGALPDSYLNTTNGFSATIGGSTVAFDNAQDKLIIDNHLLALSKEFTDDPAIPGSTVNLRFTLTNLDPTQGATDVTFTDDLNDALPGLVATGLPAAACGGTVSGTSVITLSGGSLAAGASCTFDVTLSVPASATLGTTARNVTSAVTGTIGGLGVRGDPAIDVLEINSLSLSKEFSGEAEAGGTVTLKFSIQNFSSTESVADLEFTDDLEAMLSGVVATGLSVNDVCGAGSVLTGTSLLHLTNGSLLPGGSCTFNVTLAIPSSAPAGNYLNTTSSLRRFFTPAAAEATATLTVTGTSDDDGDGVTNSLDACPGTAIPEGVPTRELKPNHYALVDDDGVFDTVTKGQGNGPVETFTVVDTHGCSCEQIIETLDLGEGQMKFGCSLGTMRTWVNQGNR